MLIGAGADGGGGGGASEERVPVLGGTAGAVVVVAPECRWRDGGWNAVATEVGVRARRGLSPGLAVATWTAMTALRAASRIGTNPAARGAPRRRESIGEGSWG